MHPRRTARKGAGEFTKKDSGRSAETGRTALIEIDEIEHRQHRAGRQTDFAEAKGDSLRGLVAPTQLHHEAVPDLDFFFGGLPTLGTRPSEHLVVAASPQGFGFQ